ncbi:flagellar basal body P-ring formation chaperone FlgA [Paralimibaculum aggregatum]|uniref:Flagella basal body P-ring formation protein FlgA n=1 Tax=Paralimibaculum aggregatum TaxID=3036245 RepID=A0ABQ6LK58_9RHOB|nr:flagellar basal body P-ring formation chaperone FlgA [Limibaculum sp. NKW23]GMG83640.1 flagellar basal body P-ring formation chaperone FlgA [Limibaculum sp. NKW23]
MAGRAPLPLAAMLALALALSPAAAAEVVAARTLRPGVVLAAPDLRGPEATVQALVGLEVRRAIYAGRPVAPGDLGPQTLVRRNAIVQMLYASARLAIRTEGRALDGGGAGERIRVMNLASRQKVIAVVRGPGIVEVSP